MMIVNFLALGEACKPVDADANKHVHNKIATPYPTVAWHLSICLPFMHALQLRSFT